MELNKSHEILKNLYTTKEYSDLEISCGRMCFRVHRAIVCTQSEALKTIMNKTLKKKGTSNIVIAGNNPFVVGKLISFLYIGDYSDVEDNASGEKTTNEGTQPSTERGSQYSVCSDTPSSSPESESESGFDRRYMSSMTSPMQPLRSPLVIHTLVYNIAAQLSISALGNLAFKKYGKALEEKDWTTDDLVRSLALLYFRPKRSITSIWKMALRAASAHMGELLQNERFLELIKHQGDIGIDILKVLDQEKSKESGWRGFAWNGFSWSAAWSRKEAKEEMKLENDSEGDKKRREVEKSIIRAPRALSADEYEAFRRKTEEASRAPKKSGSLD